MAKPFRRSISLAPELDSKVQGIVRHDKTSANRVIESLIQAGLEARESEKQRFFQLTDPLRESKTASEAEKVKQQLARMVFGD